MKKRSRKFYDVLGVKPDASPDEIKKAFRAKAKECHPDHHHGNAEKESEFKQLSSAYGVLSKPDTRRRYDETGEAPPIDNLLADAYQLIIISFQKLRDAEGDNFFYIDPLKKLKEYFFSAEGDGDGRIHKIEHQNKKNEKLLKKLVHKSGKNQSILHTALAEENRQNEAAIEKMKREIKTLQKARELLDEYSFSADKRNINVRDHRSGYTFQFIPHRQDRLAAQGTHLGHA